MRLKNFRSFKLNEDLEQKADIPTPTTEVTGCKYTSLSGNVTLYRLTSHPVVDLSAPGEYYVCDLESVSPDLLDKPSNELYLITVKCDSSNIDKEKSQQECDEKGNDCIVAVKDDTQCEVMGAEPYKANILNMKYLRKFESHGTEIGDIVVRKFDTLTEPELPIKRRLTDEESDKMFKHFSNHSWSNVDNKGRIILGGGEGSGGMYYITEDDLRCIDRFTPEFLKKHSNK